MSASAPRGTGTGRSRWWGAAVAVSASVAALAGTVAAVATAAGADRDHSERAEASSGPASAPGPALAAEASAPPVTTRPPAPPRPGRVGDPSLGATVALPAGWQAGRPQDLVPVTPGRFPTVLTLGDRATVLVGRLDATRGSGADALAAEARRLVGAFADGARGNGDGAIETVSDDAGTLDGRDAFTSVRRIADGAIVRVSTVAGAGGEPGLVVLAVAGPGRSQDADASAADRVVRTLSSDAPPPTAGRTGAPAASAAPGAPARVSPSAPPATGR